MAIINENKMLEVLRNSKKILLIEPKYRRSYLPLGLAKISSYAKNYNAEIEFARNTKPGKFDLICITSLFTNDYKIVEKVIKECQLSLFLRDTPILLGGIAASLLQTKIFDKCHIFKGYSKILDKTIPDYTLDYELNEIWNDFSYLFTQRGCINKCGYCMVHKLEPEIWVNPKWKNLINKEKTNVAISDNNILATDPKHYMAVLAYLAKIKKPVLFNNGIYAKEITKENAKAFAKLKYTRSGLRTAFDRMEDDGTYQRGMQFLLDAGVKLKQNSYTYILFNFNDTPQEAYYRAKEAWKYGSPPYLMPYRPFTIDKKGKFIGKYWTRNLVQAFKNWGELYGYNRGDRTFEGWMKSEKTKIKLTEEDWEKWNYKR